jgi:alkanesulfonate monooxygenase SsuD/methylene tetrahydromethanopterin reductase-like flavin-dependent oxidoreductase (luciferase family)
MTLAAALAVRTERIRIGTSVVILPLQHPVRLAEDALTVQALSGGRFTLGVGLGYRSSEYAGLGIPMGERRGRLEEGLEILRAALGGEELDHRGVHFDLGRIRVTPAPQPSAGPELFVGGFAPAAIRRAAAVADGMLLPIPDLWPVYAEECARIGRRPRVAAGYHWIIAEDPEAELRRVAPHVIHQVNEYGASGAYGPAAGWEPITDVDGLVRFGLYELLDAEAAARRIVDIASHRFVEDVHWWTVFPGEPIERSNARLAYVADNVMPLARELLVTRRQAAQLD